VRGTLEAGWGVTAVTPHAMFLFFKSQSNTLSFLVSKIKPKTHFFPLLKLIKGYKV
jgi:hypothetical protein